MPRWPDFDRKKAAKDGASGRVEHARRAVELARNQLAYADLKADAEGVITATLAEAGQVVGIGEAVVKLAQIGEKEALVALPETWLSEAQKSKQAFVCGLMRTRNSRRSYGNYPRKPIPPPAPMRRASPSKRRPTRWPLA